MAIIQSANDTVEGTGDGDIIVTTANGSPSETEIHAGAGDDFILLEQSSMFVDLVATNSSLATAMDINASDMWSTAYSAVFADSSVPHTSVIGQGTGNFDFFAVTLAAGAVLTLDIDAGRMTQGGGSVDTILTLFDAAGNQLVQNDDASGALGGLGSTNGLDPFIEFTATTTGTYIIRVGRFVQANAPPGPLEAGHNYILNISAQGHVASAPQPAIWDSTVFAGTGDDLIIGSSEYDTVLGEEGNDVIRTLAGNDIIRGGLGNDTVDAGEGFDTVYDEGGNDSLDGGAGTDTLSYIYATAGVTVDLTRTSSQDTGGAGIDLIRNFENLTGSDFNDTLTGDANANRLNGGLGTNIINAGAGNDRIIYGGGSDTVDGGEGVDSYDLAFPSGSWTVNMVTGMGTDGFNTISLTNIESLIGSWNNDIIFSKPGTTIDGGQGDDYIYAALGTPETLDGGDGIDTLDTTAYNTLNAAYTINLNFGTGDSGEIFRNFENLVSGNTADTVTGTSGANVIRTNGGNDNINGAFGDNIIEAGIGVNSIGGGAGFDFASYEHAASGVTVSLVITSAQATGISNDTLSNIEGLIGSGFGDTLTGDTEANTLRGLGGNDTLNGGTGDDILDGGAGNDTLNGGDGMDTADYSSATAGVFVSLGISSGQITLGAGIDTLSSMERLIGSAFGDTLTGTGLDGGFVRGMGGNDIIYTVNGADDLDGGEGIDTLVTTARTSDYTVNLLTGTTQFSNERVVNFENLVAGSGNDTLTGTNGANRIDGGAGDDVIDGLDGDDILNGGTGADEMRGGLGNDLFLVDNVGDRVIEANGQGRDQVNASVSFSLAGQFIEQLNLLGSANINATGNSLANLIFGNSGHNRIDGGTGADEMIGGLGDDIYVVDNVGDIVTELDGQGTDTVEASISFSLIGRFVENLTLTGSANIDGTGNGGANILKGNAGNNLLDGGLGADTMEGGLGNDIYIVDSASDIVTERLNQGTDEIRTTLATFTLGANVENLTALSNDAHVYTGNALANILIGGAGADELNGSGGADTMIGGMGDDIYWVDNIGDVVVESAAAGNDIVNSSVNYSLLGRFIESLFLTGAGHTNGIGNSQANVITGSLGNNILRGLEGNDTLTGRAGQDVFAFDTALGTNNVDTITDFNVTDDTIRLSRAIFTAIGPNGVLDADAFRIGSVAADAEDRIIYNSTTGNLLYDADGVGGAAAVVFARLTTGLAMTNADFFIIA